MTRVIARYCADGYAVEAKGHSGTSPTCTAVSAILGALAGWVGNNAGQHRLEKGYAHIGFPKQDGAEAVMDMTVIGLLQVQMAAPDDIKVEILCEG